MPTTLMFLTQEQEDAMVGAEESDASMDWMSANKVDDSPEESLLQSPEEERIRGGGKITGERGRNSRRHQPYRNTAASGGRNPNKGSTDSRSCKVFVGNLSWNVSWQDLKDHMRSAGDVVHAEVMCERNGRSKGTAIVTYATPDGAQQAVLTLNETQLDGRQIFVREDREDKNVAHREDNNVASAFTFTIDSSGGVSHGHEHQFTPQSQSRRVYVGNLSWNVSWQDLKDHMRAAGNVLHANIICESNGRSKGCGLVEYSHPEEALKAISTLHETNLQGRMIFVREDRETTSSSPVIGPLGQQNDSASVFVSNLSYDTSWQDLKDHMRKAGNVDQATILSQGGGSKGCAIVVYQRSQDAARAIRELQNSELDGRNISIREDRNAAAGGGQVVRNNERGSAGPERHHGGRGGGNQHSNLGHGQRQVNSGGAGGAAGCQIFVNNLAYETTWRELKDHFRQCGDVERAEVMTNAEGHSKGFGTVRFFNEKDAGDAIDRLNGAELQGRVLQVRLDTKVN